MRILVAARSPAWVIAVTALVALTAALFYTALSTPPMADQREAQQTSEAQKVLRAAVPAVLHRARRSPVARPVAHGKALATMTIPRFGAGWRWEVAEGVTPDVLDGGPGHFPGTALPGARGNSAYAAHRAGHGDPFIDFDRLRAGDRIALAQRGALWTYKLTMRPHLIDSGDVWVLDHLPGRMLTLTTCWPRYGSSRRMFVRGELVRVDREQPRPAGR